jgi:hypothetical protein
LEARELEVDEVSSSDAIDDPFNAAQAYVYE